MRRALLGLLLASGCTVDLVDEPGRACDRTHPCGAGRVCALGTCQAPDAGHPDGGWILLPDGGRPLVPPTWNQLAHGFTDVTVEPGCSLTIDGARGSKLTALVPSSDDASDTATGDLTELARLPETTEGRLRGRLTLSAPPPKGEVATFAWLGTASGRTLLLLAIDEEGRLLVRSDTDTMTAAAVSQRLVVPGGFGPGDYELDVTWLPGDVRRVFVDGTLLGQAALPPDGGPGTQVRELRLGLLSVDGDGGLGLGLVLTSWQLADRADAYLGPLP